MELWTTFLHCRKTITNQKKNRVRTFKTLGVRKLSSVKTGCCGGNIFFPSPFFLHNVVSGTSFCTQWGLTPTRVNFRGVQWLQSHPSILSINQKKNWILSKKYTDMYNWEQNKPPPRREERRFLYFNHLSTEFLEQMIPHLKALI